MEDLTESFEQQMLASLRRQTMEGNGVEEEENHKKQDMDKFRYGDDSLSDSSDDTSMANMKQRDVSSRTQSQL